MAHSFKWIIRLASLVLLLSGCASRPPQGDHPPQGFEPWNDDLGGYKLLPGDELDIKLHFNPEFSDRVIVDPDGNIHLSPIGPVNVLNHSVIELRDELQKRYAAELKRPELTVVPRQFGSEVIYVGGEVQRPGVLKLAYHMGVFQSLIEAGGALPTGSLKQVVLIRPTNRNTRMMKVIDVQAMLDGKRHEDVWLNRFDVVFVPRSTISEVNLWIDQHINQMLPFQRSFNYTLNRDVIPAVHP
ncbi:polysaccharide biosynthesis/export protein PslD [Gammaproteobacteria bacterium]